MKILIHLLLFSISILGVGQNGSVENEKEYKRKQWEVDLVNTGVGVELFKPNFGNNANSLSIWRGLQALLGPVSMSFSQGLSNERTKPKDTIPTTRFSIGANLPLPFLTVGSFTSYKEVLRGHPIGIFTLGRYSFRTGNQNHSKKASAFLNIGLGYRLRLPYASLDLCLKSELNNKAFSIYPGFVLRADGLYDRFSPTYRSVGATNYSYSRNTERSTTRTQTTQGTRVTITETSTYNVSSSPTTVSVTDIGRYFGLGLRYSQSIITQSRFSNVGHLFGVNGLVRGGLFALGANIEAGRIGHASMSRYRLSSGEYRFYRQIKKSNDYGKGSMNTFNFLVDIGLNFNNFLMALAGTIIDDEESTSFIAFNAGYSLGFHFLWNQQFDDPEIATYYDTFFFKENNYFNDPRESKGGYLGAWFLSCDIGHASLRAQWYRYRRAPLANGLMFSIAWRVG